jgi:hypothetical protein
MQAILQAWQRSHIISASDEVQVEAKRLRETISKPEKNEFEIGSM